MVDLATSRVAFLEPFFRFLNYFDTPYFFFVLIPVIWLGFSYQWGLRIYYWGTFNNLINSLIKNLIGWPRPSTDLSELGLFHPDSYGFPSGGAQMSFFLGSLLIYYWRTKTAWIIGSAYILLISFSRLYLGVHYPIDILGGWIVGALLLFLFIRTKEPLERWLKRKSHLLICNLSIAIPVVIALLFPHPNIIYIMAAAIGIALGTYFSLKYRLFLPAPRSLNEGMGRSFIGISMLFLIILLWPGGKSSEQAFAAGLFMSLAASPICRWFVLRRHM